jgi:hypothetical protein
MQNLRGRGAGRRRGLPGRAGGRPRLIDYCEADPRQALRESLLLREIAEGDLYARYRDLRDEIYQEDPAPGGDRAALLGEGGDCGNFALALDRHLCGKGSLLAFVNQFQHFDEVSFSHVALQYGGALVDSGGVRGAGGREELERAKRRMAERWVDDPTLWDLYGGRAWGELEGGERLRALDPVGVTVTEAEVKEKLPRTTYEDRVRHLRDFFCRVDAGAPFDPAAGGCEGRRNL